MVLQEVGLVQKSCYCFLSDNQWKTPTVPRWTSTRHGDSHAARNHDFLKALPQNQWPNAKLILKKLAVHSHTWIKFLNQSGSGIHYPTAAFLVEPTGIWFLTQYCSVSLSMIWKKIQISVWEQLERSKNCSAGGTNTSVAVPSTRGEQESCVLSRGEIITGGLVLWGQDWQTGAGSRKCYRNYLRLRK